MLISDGATGSGRFVTIGEQLTGNGTLEMTGAGTLWTTSGAVNVGYLGTGQLRISDGAKIHAAVANPLTDYSEIGFGASASGVVLITGNGSEWRNERDLYLARSGQGTLTVSEGGLISADTVLRIAQNAGSTGTLIIGSASGAAAVAAGTLSTPTVTFGAGTGSIVFNHTNGCGSTGAACNGTTGSATGLTFSSAISGTGSISALSGVTSLTGNLSAFTGTTTVSHTARLFLSGSYGGDMDVTSGGGATISAAVGGDVEATDATLTVDANVGGSLSLAGSTATQSTGTIAGNVALDTGSVLYTGSSGTIGGDVTVGADSVFADNGSVGGDVDVNSGGTLKGNGTVGGDANINTGGTLAPGNSIGTLNVVGDVNFAAGSTYEVEVNAQGQSDRTIATGNANITGGTIQIVPEVGSVYGVGTTYTFLTAGSVTGTFDAITLSTSSLFLDAALSYDATNAYATLMRNSTAFSSAAATANQVEAAHALDSLPVNDLSNAVAGQSTAAGAQAAYRAVTGELYAGIKGSLLEEGIKIEPSFVAGKKLWATFYGNWSERNGDDNNTHALMHKERGIAFGYDAPAEGGLGQSKVLDRIGVSFAYGHSDYDLETLENNRADGDADHLRLATYGSKDLLERLTLRPSAQVGVHMIETDRTVAFTGYTDRLETAYTAQTLTGSVEAAYRLYGKGFETAREQQAGGRGTSLIEPFATLTYGMAHINEMKESGGAAALSANDDLVSQGSTRVGLRLVHNLQLMGETFGLAPQSNRDETTSCNDGLLSQGGGVPCLLVKAELSWKRLIGSASPSGTYNFAGSNSFMTQGAATPRNAALIDLGIGLPLTPQASIDLTYNAAFASEAVSSTIRGGVSWKW
jgi:T5SS/PEP-CTERM-associated repeat protein